MVYNSMLASKCKPLYRVHKIHQICILLKHWSRPIMNFSSKFLLFLALMFLIWKNKILSMWWANIMDIYTATLLNFKTFRVLRRPHLEMLCETADCLCLYSIFKLHFLKSCNIRSIIIIISTEEAFKQNVIKNFINRSHIFVTATDRFGRSNLYYKTCIFIS